MAGPVVTIVQARLALIGGAMAMMAIFAGGIFDLVLWSPVLAAVLPCVLALAVAGRAPGLRLIGAALAIVASVIAVVLLEGGGVGDVGDAFVSGPRRLLSTDWPSPALPAIVGTVAAGLALLTALSCELAVRSRLHLLALVPIAVAYVIATALAAPLIRPWWLAGFLLFGAAFALLHPGGSLGERLTFLRGERRLAPMIALTLLLAGALSIPIAFDARADPRVNQPPEQTVSILDPIEATLALRAIDPPIPVHAIETDAADVPTHWRTAALERYSGRRWSPSLTLRPIGRTLGLADGDTIEYTVTFLDSRADLLPLPGAPVRVDAMVETDPGRTIVRVTDVEDGDAVEVVARVTAARADLAAARVAVRPLDDTVAGLTELAERLAGDGTILEQLDQLERTMRNDFRLQPEATGGGLQQALIEIFLRETQVGNEEQFATGFVLLARALGVDARVATGFIDEPDATGAAGVLSSDDAAIWPEVLIGGQWTPFDPIPDVVYRPSTTPPELPRTQTPAAPQPPVQPPPDPITDRDDEQDEQSEVLDGERETWWSWASRAGGVTVVIVLPIVLAAMLVLAIKSRRRRRRLNAPSAVDRVRGAWALATDALVDAGLALRASRTDREIAVAGRAVVGSADVELDRLATMSSAASFGPPDWTDGRADEAVRCLAVIESALLEDRTRWQRVRWRLSLRSIRRRTASPVAA